MPNRTLVLVVVVAVSAACSSDDPVPGDAQGLEASADLALTPDSGGHWPTGCDIVGKYTIALGQKLSGDCSPGGFWYDQVAVEKLTTGYRVSAEATLHRMAVAAALDTTTCQLTGTGKDKSSAGTEDWTVTLDWTFASIKDATGAITGYGFTGALTLAGACTITYESSGKYWGK